MRLWIRFSTIALVLGAVFVLFTGCPTPSVGSDTAPPSFEGLQTAAAEGLTKAVLSWVAATDDQTAQANIVYQIWMAGVSNVPTNGTPAFTTNPGATSYTATGLPGFQSSYFLVKAKDDAGNRDGNTIVKAVSPTSAVWKFVDGGQATGINDPGNVGSTTAAVVAGNLYAMWIQYNSQYHARVAVYNGNDDAPSWTAIDGGASAGINHTSGSSVSNLYSADRNLAGFNNRLYASWTETSGTAYQLRVAVYDPASPGWTFVDGNAADGLNFDTSYSAYQPALVVSGSSLYVVWLEDDDTALQVRASRYNGDDSSPSWTSIDGGGVHGINYSTGNAASSLTATVYNGIIVAAWVENSLLRVKAYDGSAWTQVDQGGLNNNLVYGANHPSLVVAGDNLYLAWSEYSGTTDLIHARVFNGSFSSPGWTLVDGSGNAGLNFDPAKVAIMPSLAELNGGLIVTFIENNGLSYQIRARAFNGDANSPVWQTIDGGATNGLNHDPMYEAREQFALSFGGKLYITWAEASGVTLTQTRVIRGM